MFLRHSLKFSLRRGKATAAALTATSVAPPLPPPSASAPLSLLKATKKSATTPAAARRRATVVVKRKTTATATAASSCAAAAAPRIVAVAAPAVAVEDRPYASKLGACDILSLDFGVHNFAYCLFDAQRGRVRAWRRLDLAAAGVNTGNVESIVDFIEQFVAQNPHVFERRGRRRRAVIGAPFAVELAPPADADVASSPQPPQQQPELHVVLENQMSSRLRVMQAVVYTYFRTRFRTAVVAPRRVRQFFDVSTGQYRSNKAASVRLCAALLPQQESAKKTKAARAKAPFVRAYDAAVKRDDLADCYLQALYWAMTAEHDG